MHSIDEAIVKAHVVYIPNGILIRSAVFEQLTIIAQHTDAQTHTTLRVDTCSKLMAGHAV